MPLATPAVAPRGNLKLRPSCRPPGCVHLARRLPFPELLERVMRGVEKGVVERSVQTSATSCSATLPKATLDSGLEVFNYVGQGRPADRLWAACRGLVLHPASGSVVATPFVRFGEMWQEGEAEGEEVAEEEEDEVWLQSELLTATMVGTAVQGARAAPKNLLFE